MWWEKCGTNGLLPRPTCAFYWGVILHLVLCGIWKSIRNISRSANHTVGIFWRTKLSWGWFSGRWARSKIYESFIKAFSELAAKFVTRAKLLVGATFWKSKNLRARITHENFVRLIFRQKRSLVLGNVIMKSPVKKELERYE